ncbi:MAG: Fic family protein [Acidimicrobiales bacterium]
MIYEIPSIGPAEQTALAKIEEIRRELRFFVAEPRRWVGSVRRVLAALAIQGSNSIEGYNVSVEDAVAALEGDDPTDAKTEDWHAVTGYRRAMTYVLQLAKDQYFEYSTGLLRSLHFMMTEYSFDAGPGLWRPGAIWIRNDATGEIVYEAPDADVVDALVEELFMQLAVASDVPVLVRAAIAHLNLVMIHPYRDGNGRMARCLQTLVLAREGILVPEFASIEEYLGANTELYYKVLAEVGQGRWNPTGDARPWIRFCLEAHYVQTMSVLRRVRESERIWMELEEVIRRYRVPVRSIAALFDATLGLRVRNSSYRTVLRSWNEEISNQVATGDLRSMVRAGLLDQRGTTRGTYYVAAGPLVDTRARLRTGRQTIDTSSLFEANDSHDPNAPELPSSYR